MSSHSVVSTCGDDGSIPVACCRPSCKTCQLALRPLSGKKGDTKFTFILAPCLPKNNLGYGASYLRGTQVFLSGEIPTKFNFVFKVYDLCLRWHQPSCMRWHGPSIKALPQ